MKSKICILDNISFENLYNIIKKEKIPHTLINTCINIYKNSKEVLHSKEYLGFIEVYTSDKKYLEESITSELSKIYKIDLNSDDNKKFLKEFYYGPPNSGYNKVVLKISYIKGPDAYKVVRCDNLFIGYNSLDELIKNQLSFKYLGLEIIQVNNTDVSNIIDSNKEIRDKVINFLNYLEKASKVYNKLSNQGITTFKELYEFDGGITLKSLLLEIKEGDSYFNELLKLISKKDGKKRKISDEFKKLEDEAREVYKKYTKQKKEGN